MRSQPTNVRGDIALIRAKSGLVVGTAKLTECKPALSRENYMDHKSKHAIPDADLDEVLANGWVFPWVLGEVKPLANPVPSRHKPGPVIFVNLDASVSGAIARASQGLPAGSIRDIAQPSVVTASHEKEAEDQQRTPTAGTKFAKPSKVETEPTFTFRPERAQAYGRLLPRGEFLVLEGSTAMRSGSPNVKRDIELRDQLVRDKVMVPDSDPRLYRFARNYVFSSASKAAGVIKDGNASGPSLWKNEKTGITLKDYISRISSGL
jgi:hypothetical protein